MSRIHSSGPIFILILYLCLVIHLSPEKTFGSDSGEKPYSNLQLFRLGPQRIFKGPYLKEIAFPLGGIGTGTISIGGRGNLRDWEIFNRPGKGVNLPFSFFAIHFKQEGKSPVVRVLEGPLSPPFRENFGHGARREFVPGLPQLEAQTQRFIDLFFSQTLPPYVLESVSSQVSIIRTPTCFWLENGNFFGYEGCDDSLGCCPLNCSHVSNYAQSLAFLFPSLERSMRETDFLNNVKTDGDMVFRTTLPLGDGRYWNHMPAADGQMGRIISLYRDWQISGDLDFLKNIWPEAKKALEYAWISWDKDKDGIMEGVQHNTYDIEFHGPNSMISSIYLGALLAGFHMAEAVGDGEAAKIYKRIFSKGKKKFEDLLWGDGYYVQNFPGVMDEPFQYGIGCLSDQILGQWFGMVAGLGRFLSWDRVKTALQSVYQHNFVTDFREHSNIQRVFALGNEKGLLVCSWPKGGKPSVPFRYSDEVWTGIEYQVASHLIYENFIEEGLSIVKAIRERYDGRKRNPWNEEECGSHYVRAMASWGVLTALTGYSYSGPEKKISFDPKVHHEKFKCFWSCGSGWGSFSQESEKNKREKIEILVEFGSLKLKQFTFHLPPSLRGKKIVSLEALLKNRSLDISFFQKTDVIHIKWDNLLSMMAGDTLELKVLF